MALNMGHGHRSNGSTYFSDDLIISFSMANFHGCILQLALLEQS